MEKQYTVKNVSEMINNNIQKNKSVIVRNESRSITYSLLLFLTLSELIAKEKGCKDIIKKLAEDNNTINNLNENSFVLPRFHTTPWGTFDINRTNVDVYREYVKLVNELYEVDNAILRQSLLDIYSTIENNEKSNGKEVVPDEVAYLITYVLSKYKCKKVDYLDAEDANICMIYSNSVCKYYTSQSLPIINAEEKHAMIDELVNLIKSHNSNSDLESNPKYQEIFKKLSLMREYEMHVDSDPSIYGSISDDLPFVFDAIDQEKYVDDAKADSVIRIFKHSDNADNTYYLESFIDDCLKDDHGYQTAILLIPTEWLYAEPSLYLEIDEQEEGQDNLKNSLVRLYKGKKIRTIIELPDCCIGGRSFSLLVLNTKGQESDIRFINATECIIPDDSGLCLDVNAIIESLDTESEDSNIMQTFPYDYWDNDIYSTLLIPHVWAPIEHANETRHLLANIVKFYQYDRYEISDISKTNYPFKKIEESELISLYEPHDDFYDIIVNNKQTHHSAEYQRYVDTVRSHSEYNVVKLEKNSIIIEDEFYNTLRFYGAGSDRYICQGVAFHTNMDYVTPEYLIYAMKQMNLPYHFTHGVKVGGKDRYKIFFSLPVVILDSVASQMTFVDSILKSEFDKRMKELSADQDRFKIRSAAADIQHMLGTPFSQQQVCMELIKRSKDEATYKKNVEALIDISGYIQRVVTSVGADIASAEFNPKDVDLIELVKQYITSYGNFSSGYFKVSYAEGNADKGMSYVDEDMIKLLLDTIMDNAGRHGFGKKSDIGNLVQVRLDYYKYKDLPYYRISVMNNGKPKNPDYSVRDFISRGNFDGESGRTGLGGYHIHQIARKHNGFVGLDSDKKWGFIVNVLIPVKPGSKIGNVKYISDDKEYV